MTTELVEGAYVRIELQDRRIFIRCLRGGELLLHPGFMAFDGDDDARLLAWHKKHWPTGKKQT